MQKTEYQKMLEGELYDAADHELTLMRVGARAFMQEYNLTPYYKKQREFLL